MTSLSTRKILVLCNTFWFLVTFKSELIESFLERGYIVEYSCLGRGPISLSDEGVQRSRLEIGGRVRKRYLWSLFAERTTYEAVFAYTLPFILIEPFLGLKTKRRVVTFEGLGRVFSSIRIRGRAARRVVERIYRHLCHKHFDFVVVMNTSDYVYLLDKGIVEARKLLYTLGTGIPKRFFIANKPSRQRDYITIISRVSYQKGVNTVMALIKLSTYYEMITGCSLGRLKFRLVVPSADVKKLESYMHDPAIAERLEVIEYGSDVINVYKEAFCLVHPTKYAEGLPRVVLEACAMEVPVICTHCPGVVDLLVDSKSVLFIDEDCPFDIFKAICLLKEDESLHNAISRNAKSIVSRIMETHNPIETYTSLLNSDNTRSVVRCYPEERRD